MAERLSKALGINVIFNNVTPEQFRNFGFPGADDLGNMFQFKRDFNKEFNEIRDEAYSKELNPELMDFDKWLSVYGSKIPIE